MPLPDPTDRDWFTPHRNRRRPPVPLGELIAVVVLMVVLGFAIGVAVADLFGRPVARWLLISSTVTLAVWTVVTGVAVGANRTGARRR